MAGVTSLNPEQKQAVEHGEGPLLIIAGAGTGKTTVVTERIKHLIKEKKCPTVTNSRTYLHGKSSKRDGRTCRCRTPIWIY